MWLYRLKFSSVLIHLVNTFSYKLRNSVERKGKVMAAHTSAYSLWATETVKESKRACDREVDRVIEIWTLSRSEIWFILTEGALSFNSCYNSCHTLYKSSCTQPAFVCLKMKQGVQLCKKFMVTLTKIWAGGLWLHCIPEQWS